ncbi:ABC transporter permease [Allorhodopirellula heiligendammensis]|uniref:FtsX-like permease family protein n=1 Tax=Allorhodopirellula heiligendammensis TaxID=2714739 RepID=A0A5C6BFQ2_9BACT|nr:FtsX-like permease family protein [Allorhodopirellula heiligendammensis]TWU10973.1 FtsX-like permease family protein [Allorhodopirellula heiligendammensis]
MNLLFIAWRNFRYRALSSFLTTLSLMLGVGLVVMVMAIYGIISEAFVRNASVGYNLVVGPPGSALQLTLNSVYYLSQPIENLPYTEYMEFFPQEQRAEMVREYGGDPALGERDGVYAGYVAGGYVIPLALGDYYGDSRVVGTTPEFFEKLRHGPDVDQPFVFREGRAFETYTPENQYFECVLGSRVAAQSGLQVGDTMNPTHGDPEGKGHGQGFQVVGVLAPTGTPNDRAVFVNLEGFYLLEGHARPLEEDAIIEPPQRDPDDERPPLLMIPEREVTSILVRNGNLMFAPGMQNRINETKRAQAAAPIGEINKLMSAIVGPLLSALLVITLITCVVAAFGVLVAIYNSMNDRRRDIAVMRALGARRGSVTWIILFESLIIAVVGGAAGWFLAHVAILAAGGFIEQRTGVQVSLFSVTEYEWLVLPFVILLSLLAGIVPAMAAYRTDVGSNLSA